MFYAFNIRGFKKIIRFLVAVAVVLVGIYIAVNRFFPIKHMEVIEKYAEQYNLDTAMVCAVINVESGFNENAKSSKGASGLMQIMQRTADWAADDMGLEGYSYDNIFMPDTNINIGCWYLNRLIKQYNGNEMLVMAAYNAGSGNVSKWLYDEEYSADGETLHTIPYKETENYVKRIEINRKIYEIILKVKSYEK